MELQPLPLAMNCVDLVDWWMSGLVEDRYCLRGLDL
jgi:hypothetical protein